MPELLKNPLSSTVAKSINSSILNTVKPRQLPLTTLILIFLGVSILLFIGAVSVWGDIKAVPFDNLKHLAAEPLSTLQCPAIITSSETGTIFAIFSNVRNLEVTMDTRATITNGSVGGTITIDNEVLLEPEESQRLSWQVNAQNATADHFILARIHQLAMASQPLKNASCGIFVINLPFLTGQQFLLISMGLAGLLSIGGIILFAIRNNSWSLKNPGLRRLLIFIAVSLLFSVGGLMGYWGFALFVLIVWLMLVFELFWFFSRHSRKSKEKLEKNA